MYMAFDPVKLKSDFAVFDHNPNLVYLDSTATALKPRVVIEKLREYYEKYPANVCIQCRLKPRKNMKKPAK